MLQEIVNNAAMGMVVVGPKMDVRLWNRWMVQMTGIEAEAAYGRILSDLLPPFGDRHISERVEKALTQDMSSTLAAHSTTNILPSGPVEVMVQPLRTRHHFHSLRPASETRSDALCLVQIKRLSAAKGAEHPRASEAIAPEPQGVTEVAKLQFLATVSHQIRTPVNGVLGIAELMHSTNLDAEQRRYVELIVKSGQALLQFINGLADLANLESGMATLEKGPSDLPRLLKDTLDMFATTGMHKGVRAILDIEPDLPGLVETDAQKLRQILVNLLGNAFKFTDRGSVALAAHVETEGEQAYLDITVSDTGIGIPKDRIVSLFEKNSLEMPGINRHYSRTGLGLILCKSLVDLFDGEISVDSTLGEGSRFEVRVPIRVLKEEAASLPEVVAYRKKEGRGPWQVLVAEDNPVNQTLFRALLERHGHNVTVVNNGQEAVVAVQVREPYDIILMDITMPVMDGLEATAMIRSLAGATGNTPILALTAHAMDGDREKFLDAGMDGYQSKPVEPSVLLDAMANVIQSHRATAEDIKWSTAPGRSGSQANETTSSPRSPAPGQPRGTDHADR